MSRLTGALLALAVCAPACTTSLDAQGPANLLNRQVSARVVAVLDGDTVDVVIPPNRRERVRLHGADTPEMQEPFNNAARNRTRVLLFERDVTLHGRDVDTYGRLVARVLDSDDLTHLWPALLRERYGRAFSAARRLAGLLTIPQFLPATGPIAMRSRALMTVAVRVMGNLVTDADADLVARAWRTGGRTSMHWDRRPLFA